VAAIAGVSKPARRYVMSGSRFERRTATPRCHDAFGAVTTRRPRCESGVHAGRAWGLGSSSSGSEEAGESVADCGGDKSGGFLMFYRRYIHVFT
jgi:hypothetical protein